MHRVRHEYACDLEGCGVANEYASPHDMPSVHITVEPGRTANLNFCTVAHLSEWLVQHNLEGLGVKE